jgi:hypothetical protein
MTFLPNTANCQLPTANQSPTTSQLTTDNRQLTTDWPYWLPLALLSWWLAWKLQDPFISDWDGFDYTALAVEGLPTALGLGRALFLGYNHWLWRAASRWLNWPPAEAYLVLRYAVIAQTGFAVRGFYALFKELTAQRLAAWIATLLMVASPYFIIYSGRAMSEIPGFMWLAWSLWWLAHSARTGRVNQYLFAALLLGMSANLREFAVFYFPAVVFIGRAYRVAWWRCVTACGLAVLAAFSGMIFWAMYDGTNYINAVVEWYGLSAKERKLNPVTLKNLEWLLRYAFDNSAIVTMVSLPALLWLSSKCFSSLRHSREGKQRGDLALLGAGLCGLLADTALVMNHDLVVNARYLLTGMFGLAAVSGWALAEWMRLYRWRVLPLLFGLLILTQSSYHRMARELYQQSWAAWAARDYYATIRDLPWHAAFIVGARTPLIHFYAGVGAHRYWAVIPPGAGWPDEKLDQKIEDLMMAGRAVYVDFNAELWQTGAREKSREHAGLEHIRTNYELEHIRHQLYRVVRRKHVENLQAHFSSAAMMPIC